MNFKLGIIRDSFLNVNVSHPFFRLTENQKERMKEKWLQYREQRLNEPLGEQDDEGPSLLQKRRRLPKKRGRKKLQNENWLQNRIRNNLDL
jgi:hypothetical protein